MAYKARMSVKNTFLEFTIPEANSPGNSSAPILRRQHSDSILDGCGAHLWAEYIKDVVVQPSSCTQSTAGSPLHGLPDVHQAHAGASDSSTDDSELNYEELDQILGLSCDTTAVKLCTSSSLRPAHGQGEIGSQKLKADEADNTFDCSSSGSTYHGADDDQQERNRMLSDSASGSEELEAEETSSFDNIRDGCTWLSLQQAEQTLSDTTECNSASSGSMHQAVLLARAAAEAHQTSLSDFVPSDNFLALPEDTSYTVQQEPPWQAAVAWFCHACGNAKVNLAWNWCAYCGERLN